MVDCLLVDVLFMLIEFNWLYYIKGNDLVECLVVYLEVGCYLVVVRIVEENQCIILQLKKFEWV